VNLPELGVGLTYFSALDPVLEANLDLVDVLEVEPQTLWFRTPDGGFRVDQASVRRVETIPRAKLMHGIGFPVGGVLPPDPSQVPPLLEMAARLAPPWMSEHLSFNRVHGEAGAFNTGFMLPPRQTWAGVEAAVASIRAMAGAMPVPLAVETGVSYLRPRPDEMPDGAFVAAVAARADCGILLDLHNLWANERNGRQTVEEFLGQIPLERVWEVHLAGGGEHRGFWLDAHSGPVQEPLLDLARRVLPRLSELRALIFELFPAHVMRLGAGLFRPQLEELRRLWERRRPARTSHRPSAATSPREKPGPGARSRPSRPAAGDSPGCTDAVPVTGPSPEEWEEALGGLVVGRHPGGPLAEELAREPGLDIIRELVSDFRASMIVSTLQLTSRYLLLSLGEKGFRALLEEFWRVTPPVLFASEEAENLARHLEGTAPPLPHLAEVLAFERAVLLTLLDGEHRLVPFGCDPLPVLRALGERRLPEMLIPGTFEIEVTPDATTPLADTVQVLH
jgi:uncharacterized protein